MRRFYSAYGAGRIHENKVRPICDPWIAHIHSLFADSCPLQATVDKRLKKKVELVCGEIQLNQNMYDVLQWKTN